LYLYFSLQALLFVKRTLSGSSLIGATGLVATGNAVAELTRKVIAEKITIERTIYVSPHMAGDALRRPTIAVEKLPAPLGSENSRVGSPEETKLLSYPAIPSLRRRLE